jgi:hypothetical protein
LSEDTAVFTQTIGREIRTKMDGCAEKYDRGIRRRSKENFDKERFKALKPNDCYIISLKKKK